MTPFTTHKGKVAVLYRGNIDTDQIISKEHLKSIKRTGFGPALFSDWRYLNDGSANPDFELNKKENQNASILLTGNNFGCGSSREHAVWAIAQFGFRAVIAPKIKTDNGELPAFADIFRNNSVKNGLLLIEISENETLEIKKTIEDNPAQEMQIDLNAQKLTLSSLEISFSIDSSMKERLLNGLDDIGITLKHENNILEFEKKHDVWRSPS